MRDPHPEKLTYTVIVYAGDTATIKRAVPLTEEDLSLAVTRLTEMTLNTGETAVLNETDWRDGVTTARYSKRRSTHEEPHNAPGRLVHILTMRELVSEE